MMKTKDEKKQTILRNTFRLIIEEGCDSRYRRKKIDEARRLMLDLGFSESLIIENFALIGIEA